MGGYVTQQNRAQHHFLITGTTMDFERGLRSSTFMVLALIFQNVLSEPSTSVMACPENCSCYDSYGIDCYNVSLDNIHFNVSDKLEYFSLTGAQQTILLNKTFYNMNLGSIKMITMNNDSIEQIEEGAFHGMEEIESLDLSNNKLKHIGVNVFPVDLSYLTLSGNPLVIPENGEFLNIPMLDSLTLDMCNISDIPSNIFKFMTIITSVSFRQNNINKITKEAFRSLQRLQYLDLTNNEIKYLHPDAFIYNSELQYLTLDNNKINIIDDTPFLDIPSLTTLSMTENNINYLGENTFKRLRKLERIYSPNNSISHIAEGTFKHLRDLESIDLGYNKIKSIHMNAFNNNLKLKYMTLAGNPLDLTVNIPFLSAPKVEYLDIDSCNISEVPTESFQNVPLVKEINMRNNLIEKCDEAMLENLRHLSTFEISGNPFSCKCVKNELKEWARKRLIRIRSACIVEGRTVDIKCNNNA